MTQDPTTRDPTSRRPDRCEASAPVEVLDRRPGRCGELVLRRVGSALEIIANGTFLMDTRDGRSERLLARAGLDRVWGSALSVLIGGLGVGFTTAEVLADPRVCRVVVVELEAVVLEWHRGPLAAPGGHVLEDPRVEVVCADLAEALGEPGSPVAVPASFDLVCLDVDNGPDWLVRPGNAVLYQPDGLRLLTRSVRPGGVVTVWGATGHPEFASRLAEVLEGVETLEVPTRHGDPDVVWAGRRPA